MKLEELVYIYLVQSPRPSSSVGSYGSNLWQFGDHRRLRVTVADVPRGTSMCLSRAQTSPCSDRWQKEEKLWAVVQSRCSGAMPARVTCWLWWRFLPPAACSPCRPWSVPAGYTMLRRAIPPHRSSREATRRPLSRFGSCFTCRGSVSSHTCRRGGGAGCLGRCL